MKFGLFGSAQAQRGGPDLDSGQGFRDYVEYNVEAEALGYNSTFVVEHHFTGFGQVSASLSLLTWVAARTKTLRLGTAVMVLPWHNPVLLAEQAATIDLLSGDRLASTQLAIERFNIYKAEVEACGRKFDPMDVALSRAFFVARNAEDKAKAVEARLANQTRLAKLAQTPDGNSKSSMLSFDQTLDAAAESAMFGTPDEISEKLSRLRAAGVE